MVWKYDAVRDLVPKLRDHWADLFGCTQRGMLEQHPEGLWVIENFMFQNGIYLTGEVRKVAWAAYSEEIEPPYAVCFVLC